MSRACWLAWVSLPWSSHWLVESSLVNAQCIGVPSSIPRQRFCLQFWWYGTLFRATVSLFLEEVSVILCGNLWNLFQVSETCHVSSSKLGNHFHKTIGNAIKFRLFWKKESKKIRQLLRDQILNKKYSIVLKQSISKPATQTTQFDALWEFYPK